MLTATARPRALYVGAAEPRHVGCTDEALVVSSRSRGVQRFPIARVARVVSAISVDWSGRALALCLRRGIPLSWVDAEGRPLGACYPSRRIDTELGTALDILLDLPEGCERYQSWLRARRMNVLKAWAQESPGGLTPLQWENAKRGWVYGGCVAAHLPTGLRHLALCHVAARLAQCGLGPVYIDARGDHVHLDEDLCELLWGEMNLMSGAFADQPHDDSAQVHLFERWMARHAGALEAHLASLTRFVHRELRP